MSLQDTNISLSLRSLLQKTIDVMSAPESRLAFSRSVALANGTGAGQADRLWADTRTIVASGTDDLDLAGSFVDALGDPVVFAKIKAFALAAVSGNTNNVVIGAAAATQFVGWFGAATHTEAVAPGGWTCHVRADAAGWPVVGGASDLLRIANGGAGTPVTYDVVIIGTSA